MDMIIVSSETLSGGEKINSIRESKGFRHLEIYSIPLVEVKQLLVEKEGKVSSSNRRMDILGSLFRKPEPRPNLSMRPYSELKSKLLPFENSVYCCHFIYFSNRSHWRYRVR